VMRRRSSVHTAKSLCTRQRQFKAPFYPTPSRMSIVKHLLVRRDCIGSFNGTLQHHSFTRLMILTKISWAMEILGR